MTEIILKKSNRSSSKLRLDIFLPLFIGLLAGVSLAIAQSVLPHGGYIPLLAFTFGLVFIPSALGLTARNRWLPQLKRNDLLVGAAALFMIWLYLPFINGASSSSALLQSMGGDIVAHFTMVVKTIETGVSGSAWGLASDGTSFVYVNYPQHFHTIAAYLGQSFTKGAAGTIESNAATFMAGLALTIILSVTVLSSLMIESMSKVKGSFLPGLLVIASTASISAGFGASNVQSGFPNFVMAAIGVLFVFFISIQFNKVSSLSLIAGSSGVLLVINSWFLLSPIALGMFAVLMWRFLMSKGDRTRQKWIPICISLAIVIIGYAWALSLIAAASSGIGGPVNVLSVPGGTLSMPLRQVFGLTFLVLAVGIFLLTRTKETSQTFLKTPAFGSMALVAFSLALLFGLIAFQRFQGVTTSYYQLKLANGIYLIMSVALVAALVLVLDHYSEQIKITSRTARSSFYGITWLGIFLVFTSLPGFITGLEMRVGVATEANKASESSLRLEEASKVLSTMPCAIPVYMALQDGDPPADIANQWSHAMSGTWTESSGPINTYLWSESMSWDKNDKSSIVNNFLKEFPQTCVIVSPEVSAELLPEGQDSLSDKILTWK